MKINNTTDTALIVTILNMIEEGTKEDPGQAEVHLKIVKAGGEITLDPSRFNDVREITIKSV